MKAPYTWQKKQWDILSKMHNNKRLPHALLLSGTHGTGKYEFAHAFATRLLCSEPINEATPCGECNNCKLISTSNHPDLIVIRPEEDSKHIKIEQIRNMIELLNQTSHTNTKRVVIINPLESMLLGGANSMLKVIEEPNANVYFFLVCNELAAILPTIRSRTQNIQFYPANIEETEKYISQALPEVENKQLLARMVNGAPLLAHKFVDGDLLRERNLIFNSLCSITLKNQDPLVAAEQITDCDIQITFYNLLLWCYDLLHVYLGTGAELVNLDYQEQINDISKRLDLMKLYGFQDQLLNYRKKYLQGFTSLNKKLVYDHLLMQWSGLHNSL